MDSIKKLASELEFSQDQSEKEYFDFHKKRFARFSGFLDSFLAGRPTGSKLKTLEIGSHYLHTSMLLSDKGFEVDAMDVEEFWNLEFVQKRAEKYSLNKIVENDLSQIDFLEDSDDVYDLVVFTEIMEHITFNPIKFWRSIYHKLKPGGIIYISTPNAFALPNVLRSLKNIFLFKSIGITVDDILSKVTYGHHWKEYSASEIRTYFQLLSPDFEVHVSHYAYKDHSLKPPFLLFKALSRIGNISKLFSDELEVIVTLKEKTTWSLESPRY